MVHSTLQFVFSEDAFLQICFRSVVLTLYYILQQIYLLVITIYAAVSSDELWA